MQENELVTHDTIEALAEYNASLQKKLSLAEGAFYFLYDAVNNALTCEDIVRRQGSQLIISALMKRLEDANEKASAMICGDWQDVELPNDIYCDRCEKFFCASEAMEGKCSTCHDRN